MNTLKYIQERPRELVIAALMAIVLLTFFFALPAYAGNTCTGDNCLKNPIRFPTIERFIEGVLRAIVMIGIPVITVFIVYAGFKFILAQGNPTEIGKAKENFLWVILGAALILGAWVLATLIGGTVTQLLG